MSEKRYEIRTNINGEHWLFDNKYDSAIMISKIRATLLDVCNRLNEQQATIEDLQDLCGESDYENAKLRLKNKELQDKIDWLCEKYDYPNNKGVKNE